MELKKLDVKARCDMHLCGKIASYRIDSGGKGFLPWGRNNAGLYLCHDCLVALYEAIGREVVPKSPDSIIKKAEKRRKENEGN